MKLKNGDVITASQEVIDRVKRTIKRSWREHELQVGHICEFAHDEWLREHNTEYIKPENMFGAIDRILPDNLNWFYDDKVALMQPDGSIAGTHTVTGPEREHWDRKGNVTFNSFEQFDPNNPYRFMFICEYNYREIRANLMKSSFEKGGYYFNRYIRGIQ